MMMSRKESLKYHLIILLEAVTVSLASFLLFVRRKISSFIRPKDEVSGKAIDMFKSLYFGFKVSWFQKDDDGDDDLDVYR